MTNDIFLHDSMQIVTDNGIKNISKLIRSDKIIGVDIKGYIASISPSIIHRNNYGAMYEIKTSQFDLKVGANKSFFYDGDVINTVTAYDISETLVGCDIKIPAYTYEHKVIGNKTSIADIKLYALTKMKRSTVIGDILRVPASSKYNIDVIEDVLSEANVEYAWKESKVGRTYYIKYRVETKKIPSAFCETMNLLQAQAFIEMLILFDTAKLHSYNDGRLILCEEYNAYAIIMILLKAGYRCSIGNNYKYRDGIDSISISKHKFWDTNIISAHLRQNDRQDRVICLPDDYCGFYVISYGRIFLISNEYINKRHL